MDVSIVIVNRNTSGLLSQCLDSISSCRSRLALEIVVVDNGSTDDSVEVIQGRFPSVTLIQNDQNLGFAPAANQGLSRATGRYFMLLNSDTIVLPGAIEAMVQVADRHSAVGVIGPKLLNMDNTVQESWASFPSLTSELLGRNFRIRRPAEGDPHAYDVDWVGGACLLVKAESVEDVGKLDDEYFFYSEEIDWCYRFKEKGWKVWYLPDARVYHLGGGSCDRTSLRQLLLLYRGKLLYFAKHHGQVKTVLLRYGLAAVSALGLIRRVVFFDWRNREASLQRIMDQSTLVWCLLWNRYPGMPGYSP